MSARDFTLSPLVSFRTFGDTTALVEHESGTVVIANRAAGDLLVRLDRGEVGFDPDELEVLEALAELGAVHIRGEALARAVGSKADPRAGDGDRSDIMEELNREAERLIAPLHCQVELTYACALHCGHCYLGGDPGDRSAELTTPEMARFLAELADLGGLFLLFTGGEPFLRGDLEDIFHQARDLRFAVSFLTSGFGLDPGLAARLAARGIDGVQVSLYGADAATHERLTGVPGSFRAALDALDLFSSLGVRVQAGVTATSHNAAFIDRIAELLAVRGVPLALSTYIEPRRDGLRAPQTFMVDEDGLRQALRASPESLSPRLESRGLDDSPCGAGRSVLSLDPFGGVFPCHALRLRVGSVRDEPLATIWRGSQVLSRLRALRVRDLEDCPACPDRASCNRCPGFAVAEGLGERGHAPFDCLAARVLHSLILD